MTAQLPVLLIRQPVFLRSKVLFYKTCAVDQLLFAFPSLDRSEAAEFEGLGEEVVVVAREVRAPQVSVSLAQLAT